MLQRSELRPGMPQTFSPHSSSGVGAGVVPVFGVGDGVVFGVGTGVVFGVGGDVTTGVGGGVGVGGTQSKTKMPSSSKSAQAQLQSSHGSPSMKV
jgi:hypothetical protein